MPTHRALPLVLVLLAACTGVDPGTKTDSGAPTDPSPPVVDSGTPPTSPVDTSVDTGTRSTCDVQVVALLPDDGATDAFYRGAVHATLSTVVSEAQISVADASGVVIPGATDASAPDVVWTGDPLAPNTDYHAEIDYGCGKQGWTFRTDGVGLPISGDPTGNVYELDLASAYWASPPGVGPLLASQLGDTSFLLSPTALGTDTIDLLLGIGSSGTQDPCSATVPLPQSTFADPYFEYSGADLEMVLAGVVIGIEDATMSGAFRSDLSAIGGGVLAGSLDTRPLIGALGLSGDEYAVCDLVAAFGVSCVTCPDGAVACLDMRVEDVLAPIVVGATLVERTQADIDADPTCY